jgi:hypothetical protein
MNVCKLGFMSFYRRGKPAAVTVIHVRQRGRRRGDRERHQDMVLNGPGNSETAQRSGAAVISFERAGQVVLPQTNPGLEWRSTMSIVLLWPHWRRASL